MEVRADPWLVAQIRRAGADEGGTRDSDGELGNSGALVGEVPGYVGEVPGWEATKSRPQPSGRGQGQ
jgi:hypothetical protein